MLLLRADGLQMLMPDARFRVVVVRKRNYRNYSYLIGVSVTGKQ
jgi:hypothetical protein